MSAKNNIHPYLSGDLYKRFKAYCKVKGLTESSVVEAALQQYFDDTHDTKLLYRRLDRQSRALGRLDRDMSMMSEVLAVFVQVWFAYTPKLPESEREPAQRQSRSRYDDFLNHVAKNIGSGKGLLDVLMTESIADPEELQRVLEDEIDDE